MADPRPEKVAVVDEVRQKLADTDGAVLTEYRGLDVRAIAELRRALREAGGEYKIYKNTLVRLAARDAGLDIDDLLVGPVAIAFVGERPDGSASDAAAVAKALKEFAKTHDSLVIKGGVVDNELLSVDDLKALAELPSRDVLLAQIAGAFQAPMAKFAGLLAAVPRDFAYGLQALIEKSGGPDAAPDASDEDTEAVASADADAGEDDGDAAPAAPGEDTEDADDGDAAPAVPGEDTEDTEDTDDGDAAPAAPGKEED